MPSHPRRVLTLGPKPESARLAVVAIHGRGASADDILGLARELRIPDVLFVAPEADGNTWYPYSFLTPIERNEPHLSSALGVLRTMVETLGQQGIGPERVGFLGFSQGACLSLEFTARNARRYAGVFALSGGLIGPPGTPRDYEGTFGGTPVFLGCSDVDAHIPVERVHESAEVFERMGAAVDRRIYPGMGHTVNSDELKAIRKVLGNGTSG